jgi:hypothetical protein
MKKGSRRFGGPFVLQVAMASKGTFLKSACVVGILIGGCLTATAQQSQVKSDFNDRRNTLIADQFNNRVVEVDRKGNIVWQFGLGPADFSPVRSSAPTMPSASEVSL